MRNITHNRQVSWIKKITQKVRGWNVLKQGSLHMHAHASWKHWVIVVVVLSGLWGCKSSSTSPNKSCFRTGDIWYAHYKSLTEDPATFPDGSELKRDTGYTVFIQTSDGFLFNAGSDASWEIDATCDGADRATLDITLHNRCPGKVHSTSATSTLQIREDGTITISPYYIDWSCDEGVTFFVKEWWEMEIY